MNAVDKRRLHPDDVKLWLAVEGAITRLADFTDTRLHWIRPLKKSETDIWWGMYHGYPQHGIEIAVRDWHGPREGWEPKVHRLYQLVDTIAHEMAHAKVGIRASHGNRWFAAYAHCLDAAVFLDLRFDLLKSGAKFPPE